MSIFSYWSKCKTVEGAALPVFHLLAYHCLDVAATAAVLLERLPRWQKGLASRLGLDEDAFRSSCLFFTAVHDLGKFAAGFQGLQPAIQTSLRGAVRQRRPYALRHDTIGSLFWRDAEFEQALVATLATDLQEGRRSDRECALDYFQIWSHATLGHHGVPPKVEAGRLPQVADLPHDRDAAIAFIHQIDGLFKPRLTFADATAWREAIPRLRRASWQLAGFAVLCDWIGSSELFFRYRSDPCDLGEYWQQVALPAARSAVEQCGLIPAAPRVSRGFANLFPAISTPTPLQELADRLPFDDGPSLFCLEDLTGAGKTEAAATLVSRLLANGHASGVYFALPTMATANAMYERLAAFYRELFDPSERPSLVLAHGTRHLHDGYRSSVVPDPGNPDASYGDGLPTGGASCSRWLAHGTKKALLAQVGVGTIDQALLGVLPVRHQSLRMLGLADKVLVVDEVHACDEYMTMLLERLLAQVSHSGGSAILLSATLPGRLRQRLADAFAAGAGLAPPKLKSAAFPLLTRVSGSHADEVPVATRPGSARALAFELVPGPATAEDLAISLAADGHCVCWVRNTVREAAEAYRSLKNRRLDGFVDLMHARFTVVDRLSRERMVVGRFGPRSSAPDRRGRILVATQVVEQSLDLDFDHMISDLAPIDLLLQRAGRLRRHARDERGDRQAHESRQGLPTLRVVAPVPTPADDDRWLSRVLPGTCFVYRQPGHLWRTAWLLDREGRMRLPDDSRRWIETVFSDDIVPLPVDLQTPDLIARGQTRAEASLAALNALDLAAGYAPAESVWEDDVEAMTRLGDWQVTLRLARWIDGGLHPWSPDGSSPWAGGDIRLRVPRYGTAVLDAAQQRAIEELPETIHRRFDPDIVPMVPHAEGTWRSVLRCDDGKLRELRYADDAGAHLLEPDAAGPEEDE